MTCLFQDRQTPSCLGRAVEGLSWLLLPVFVFGFLSLLPCPNLLSVRRWLVHAHIWGCFYTLSEYSVIETKPPHYLSLDMRGYPGTEHVYPSVVPKSAVLYEYKSIIVPSQARLEIPATFLVFFFYFVFFCFLIKLFIQHTEELW